MKCCFAARWQVGKALKRLTNDWAEVMDGTDEKILDLLKGNARMSYQELGDAIGMSRVKMRPMMQQRITGMTIIERHNYLKEKRIWISGAGT